jgi:hypothetical protein
MARAYPGYEYQPYPKMVHDDNPLGYRIVKSKEEHDAYLKSKEPVKKKQGPAKSKLIFTEA